MTDLMKDQTDVLGMSDEDIANMVAPPPVQTQEVSDAATDGPGDAAPADASGDAAAADGDSEPSAAVADGDGDDATQPQGTNPLAAADDQLDQATQAAQKPKAKVAPKSEEPAKAKTPDQPANPESAEPVKAPDYEAEFKKIMAPFKANGKTIELKDPSEVIELMQLGANYTKKMKQLQPNLRLMKMLENNGLLSEEKLTYLIDLEKKNPEAIRKLVKDSSIDPMDLDVSTDPGYKPGNYRVSDAQVAFETAIEEALSSDQGKDTIRTIEREWDRESQQRLVAEPALLKTMTGHRQSGIYDQISGEIARQRVLGRLTDVTFLDAYKTVGDHLHTQGLLKVNGVPTNRAGQAPASQPAVAPAQPPQVLESRPAAPKPAVTNSDKARAAAATRSTPPKKTSTDFNPLAMSDEDFQKLPARL